MEKELKRDILLSCYFETLKKIKAEDLSKYNLKTIDNFIYHFENVTDENKKYVFDSIKNYLDLVTEIDVPSSFRDTNLLYEEYIVPLLKFYVPLGFRANLSWYVLIFVFVVSTPLLYMLNFNWIAYFSVYVLFFLFKLKSHYKQNVKKLYGPNW